MNVTANVALNLIPESLSSQPIFLRINDTIVQKSGKRFEDVSKLFDHAMHNGSNYLNRHCFVSVMLCVPVWSQNQICYTFVPFGYRMWQGEESKLKLVASMIRQECQNLSKRTFWSLCSYIVRSRIGIEMLVNLITIAYSAEDTTISISGIFTVSERKHTGSSFCT